ncbi:MAG TPA: DUF2147 domain-containing protein [Chryseosolibacter sp.]|nr:DUF2147 domain-containing protein [Chryseosolibacter sp.]
MNRLTATILLLCISTTLAAQSVIGKWKTIDDETGEEKSVVEIYSKNDKVYGKVIKLFRKPGEDPDPVCDDCEEDDPRFRKKIIGMDIILDMEASDGEYSGGTILDPANGKVYKCKLWVEDGELQVRGYWGPFFRTQTWKKVS